MKYNRKSSFKIFLYFCKKERANIILFFVFLFIYTLIAYLYRFAVEAILYAGVLCFLLYIVRFAVALKSYSRNYRKLERVGNDVLLLLDEMPESTDGFSELYCDIIRELADMVNSLKTEQNNIRTENIDYYTRWVHQIKTPISVMKLELQQEDTEINRMLLSELFVAEQYVDMVLCKFRLDSYSNDFVFKRQKLDEIIKKSVRKYSRLFISKKLKLNYTETDATVLTDEKWLGFMIEQILSNAVKYTENGSIGIWYAENVLHIKDTGIGIAPEDVPRIFEKGFTGYNGRAGKKSTGLGLYLTKTAADKLSHKISVRSDVGKGSEFLIDLSIDSINIE